MGTFAVTLGVADPQGRRYEEVEAMADSGAAYTVLPASILEGLGVEPYETRGSFSPTATAWSGASARPGCGSTAGRPCRRSCSGTRTRCRFSVP